VQDHEPIRGGQLTFRSSIFSRVWLSPLIVVAVLWTTAVNLPAREGSKEWIVLKDCRLIPNPANDGDSFHVSAGGKEYLFRLYFVDAPETDEMTPGRLVQQAKYFGISVPQAIEVGRRAKEFVDEKLATPFTVFTHMSDAMGQSRLERFYAFVQTKDGDLGEQLVRNGLARNYGFKGTPPGLQGSRIEFEKLQQLENEAKQEKIGAWGVSAGRLNALPQTQSSFSFFVSEEKTPLGKIDINTATEEELTTVPGIGHVMAARVIAARPFRSADDLKRVSGIGEKKYAQIRPYFH
jgi:endonuclease YncB( thermonuclease family)